MAEISGSQILEFTVQLTSHATRFAEKEISYNDVGDSIMLWACHQHASSLTSVTYIDVVNDSKIIWLFPITVGTGRVCVNWTVSKKIPQNHSRPGFPNSLFPSWGSCFVSQSTKAVDEN